MADPAIIEIEGFEELMNKTPKDIKVLLTEIDKLVLDEIVKTLPRNPAHKVNGGDVTVREMHPNLTEDELDYLIKKYKGNMKRG